MKAKTTIMRIFSIFLILTMLLGMTSSVGFAAENEDENHAYYSFENRRNSENVTSVRATDATYVEKDGKLALERTTLEAELYISVKLDDCFTNEEGQPVIISVEYFDEGEGMFTIAYSGTNNTINGRHTNVEDIVYLENTGEWKTHEFYIEDITFDHSYYDGYDFRIGLWSESMGRSVENVYIHSFTVEKVPPKDMVLGGIESEYVGNIFGPGEDKQLTMDVDNRTESEFTGTVDYTVRDFYGMELFTKTEDVKIAPAEAAAVNFDMNEIDKFGVYTLETAYNLKGTVNGEEHTFTDVQTGDFSYVNKVPHELKNSRMNIGAHGTWYDMEETAILADWLGSESIRDEIRWRYVEQEKGSLSIPADNREFTGYVKEKDLKTLQILAYGNWLYYGGTASNQMVAPETEEQLDAWERYCGFIAEYHKNMDLSKEFEVWNEYNITAFNSNEASAENYVEMTKRANRAVKAQIPDAKIIGGGFAGTAVDYLKNLLSLGIYDYVDGFSCHPYDWSGDFRNETFVAGMNQFNDAIDEYGGNKLIYLTELGINDGTKADTGVPTMEKASMIIQAYSLMVGEDLADKWWWYDIIKDSANTTDQESNFGLVKAQSAVKGETKYAATPAYVVMTNMNCELTGATPNGSILYDEDPELRAYRFKTRDNKDVATVWCGSEPTTVSFNLGCDTVDIYDLYGNYVETIHGNDGVFTFTLAEEPIYIKGDLRSFEKADSNIVTAGYTSGVVMSGQEITVPLNDALGRDLTVEVDLSEGGFELTENNGLTNGSGSVTLKSLGVDGDFNIKYTFYEDGTAVGMQLSRFTVGQPVELEITDFEQTSTIDDSCWRAVIKIRNITRSNTFDGVCEPTGGIDPSKGVNAVKFFDLGPGEEQTIYMNLPPQVKKRNTTVSYKVTINGADYFVESRTNFQTAGYAYNKPNIDGTIDRNEWSGAWVTADQEENAYSLVAGTTWGGPSDVSFEFNTMWDEENLYMAVAVEDNVFCNNEPIDTMWAGDCLQFGIEDQIGTGNYVLDGQARNSTFTEMAFAMLPTGPAIYRYKTMNPSLSVGAVDMTNCKLAMVREGTTTVYEISIPWSEMFGEGYEVDPDRIYMFSAVANDNDGSGRWGYIEYNSGIAREKNAMDFGRLRLLK